MKPVFFIFLLLGMTSCLVAQKSEFIRSVELLQNDNPIDAIAIMDSIIAEGYASAELYSNLGQAHFAQGDNAKAMLYYEKALLMDPGNQDIQNSIVAIRRQLDVQITDIPDFILVAYYRKVVNIFSASSWGALQILFGLISLGALYLYLFPRHNSYVSESNIKILGISCLLISLLFLVFSKTKKNYELGKNQGIVMESNVAIHQAPDKLSPEIAPVSEGNKVFIISELGEWYKVSLRDKDSGWVKKEEVAII